jgi:tripartite-type tricarboxylate transporter receptor subunit TctC
MLAIGAAGLGMGIGPAAAQWVPPRQVRLVVPFPPAGGADTTARLLASVFSTFLGQPTVVENRPGAGGTIGAGEVARAAPDGTTLLVDAANQAVAPFIFRNLNFDYTKDFTPISRVTVYPMIAIVRPDSAHRTLASLLDKARAEPGRVTYSSSGNAVSNHIATAVLASRAKVEMTHVPYRGGGPALAAVLAGDVDFGFATVASAAALAQDGRVRALAASSAERIPALPDVPTVAEQGFPGFKVTNRYNLYAPAGTPRRIVDGINRVVADGMHSPQMTQRLQADGSQPAERMTPEQLRATLAREFTEIDQQVKQLNIKIQ